MRLTLRHYAALDGVPVFCENDHVVKTPEALRTLRARLGYDQRAMAKAWGVTLRSLRNWEQGQRNCPAHHLNRLAFWINADRKFAS